MPDEPHGQPEQESIRSLLGRSVTHPAFDAGPGKLSSRDGEPYNPVDLPADPAAKTFYEGYQPPANRPADAQPPQPEEPAAQPAAEPAAASQPSRLYAGKYKNVDDLEKSYQEVQRTLRDREAELRAVRAVRQELEPIVSGFRNARQEPTPAPRIPIQFDPQGTPYVDPAAFEALVAAKAAEVANERVSEVLTPISRLNTASQNLRALYPELGSREAEFSAFIRNDPELSRKVSEDPDYLELAYLRFDRQNQGARESAQPQTQSPAQTAIQSAKTQASASTGGSGGGRRVSGAEDRQRRLEAIAEQCARTGDYRPLIKARLEEAVNSDGHLDAMEKAVWGR